NDQDERPAHGPARIPNVGDGKAEEEERAEVRDQRDRVDRVLPDLPVGQHAVQPAGTALGLQLNRLYYLHFHLWPISCSVWPAGHEAAGEAPGATTVTPSGASVDESVRCVNS